jgi:hypothetical protein
VYVVSRKPSLQDGFRKFAITCRGAVPAEEAVDEFWVDARKPFELLALTTDEPIMFTGVMVVMFYCKLATAMDKLAPDDLAAATANQLEEFISAAEEQVSTFNLLVKAGVYDVKPWAQKLHLAFLAHAKAQSNTVLKNARRAEPAPCAPSTMSSLGSSGTLAREQTSNSPTAGPSTRTHRSGR